MSVELTYEDISQDRFLEALKTLIEKDLDVVDAVGLGRSLDVVTTELSNYNKVRESLIKRLGIPYKNDAGEVVLDKDGETPAAWTMNGASEENLNEFNSKFKELMETKFELPLNGKILIGARDGKMKPAHAYILRKVIDLKV